MKTFYILLLFTFLSSLYAQLPAYEGGTEPRPFEPPKTIVEKFKKEHPHIIPTWHVEEKYYVADFADTVSLKDMAIVYDKNGKIVRRESEMDNSSYPSSIAVFYVKNYPGEKFKTWKCIDDKGTQSYCIKRQSGSLWFDKDGNYLDPEKKNEPTAAVN